MVLVNVLRLLMMKDALPVVASVSWSIVNNPVFVTHLEYGTAQCLDSSLSSKLLTVTAHYDRM